MKRDCYLLSLKSHHVLKVEIMFFRRERKDEIEVKVAKDADVIDSNSTDVEVELTVAEAYLSDIGRGIARIDPEVMEKMGLRSGDVIEIVGKDSVPAIVWQGYPEDRGRGMIRIDGGLRTNAGVEIDDEVKVRRVKARPTDRVVIAPTEPVRLMGGETYLLRLLEGRATKKGQKFKVEILEHVLTFIIISTVPDGVVIVTKDTEIDLKDEPVKPINEEIRENPRAMLKGWINKKVVVFTTGSPIVGVLKGYDNEFNLILKEVSFLENNELKGKFKDMLVNGGNVISISLYED